MLLLTLVLPTTVLAEGKGETLALQFSSEIDPEQPQFIDELSSFAGAPLRYVKPVAGGDQHLFQLVKPLSKRQLNKVVSRLERHQQIRQVTLE